MGIKLLSPNIHADSSRVKCEAKYKIAKLVNSHQFIPSL